VVRTSHVRYHFIGFTLHNYYYHFRYCRSSILWPWLLGKNPSFLHSFWEQFLNTHLNSVARPRTLWGCRSALRVLSILDGLIPARGICDRCRVPICDLYCKLDTHIIYASLTLGFPSSFMYLLTYLFLPLAQPTNRVIPSPSLILRSHS